jgi:Flp pilus assembly protein TadB
VQQEAGPSLLTRFIALVVLVVAAWVLLKIVLGVLAGLATVIVVVLAIFGIVWALGKF